MEIEELAKNLAKNFEKSLSKKFFSVHNQEVVLDKLANTFSMFISDLSSWLIDKYTQIDTERSDDSKVEIGIFIDYDSFIQDLMVEVDLFIDTFLQEAKSVKIKDDEKKEQKEI